MELRLENVEIDLDKVKAVAHDLRGDLREFRKHLKEHLPQLK